MQTIDNIIQDLEVIIQDCKKQQNPLGYFAALYQKVTIAVKQGIENDRFEDGPRMEQLDVVFASRYLDAYQTFKNKGTPTLSWQKAFDESPQKNLIILQHLFLGINAHINLDLGIATAEVMKGKPLEDIKVDFEMINTVLFDLMKEVQVAIGMVSPLLFLADVVSDELDAKVAAFSLKATRTHAWHVAQRFHNLEGAEYMTALNQLDHEVAQMANLINTQGWFKKILLYWVWRFESKDVNRVIGNLHGAPRGQGPN